LYLVGSCWAFASVATIESAYAIKTGKLYQLSEQELVSCETKYSLGCRGGYLSYAMLWVRDNGGIASQADYPYVSGSTGTQGTCNLLKVSELLPPSLMISIAHDLPSF
jgi:C1A family cysteine protease